METRTKQLLISKVNDIKNIYSLTGLKQEIVPLMDKISKDECPNELKQLQSIIDEINVILSNAFNTDPNKHITKTKKEIENVLCDLLCV